MFRGWNLLFSFTTPNDDWLLGIEYSPENISIEVETGNEHPCAIISIGFLIIRFDILIPYRNE